MSSPDRIAKHAIKRAANAASRARPAAAPAKIPAKAGVSATGDAKRLTATLLRGIAANRLDVMSADALQSLLAATCRLYAARREAGEALLPVAKNSLTATDIMTTASGLLQAGDLAVFELGMWQGWTGR